MTVEPGFIVTDAWGDSIGLTLTEAASVVGEWDHGYSDKETLIVFKGRSVPRSDMPPIKALRIRWRRHQLAAHTASTGYIEIQRGNGRFVEVVNDDIERLRALFLPAPPITVNGLQARTPAQVLESIGLTRGGK